MTSAGDAGAGAERRLALFLNSYSHEAGNWLRDGQIDACSEVQDDDTLRLSDLRTLSAELAAARAEVDVLRKQRDFMANSAAMHIDKWIAVQAAFVTARDDAFEDAAKIADQYWDSMVVPEARGGSEVAALIRAARTMGGTDAGRA